MMKIAVLDIDGVLNYYPQTQVEFYNDRLGTHFHDLSTIKKELRYDQYCALKEEYRQSEYKHNTIPRAHSSELTHYLSNNGYLIYILTSRELFKYNQLEKTILWLKNNDIIYDYIYCSLKKDYTIFEKFGHVDIVVEDTLENLRTISDINGNNCKYYLVSQTKVNEPGIISIQSLNKIIKEN